ncbi:MAG: PEP-CTERM sorting domain-containing protein [Candidatus Auribacterota bacterium]
MYKKLFLTTLFCLLILPSARAYEVLESTGNLLANPGAENGMANWGSWGNFTITSSNNAVGVYGPTEGLYHFYSAGHASANYDAGIYQDFYFTNSDYGWKPGAYVTYGADYTGWTSRTPPEYSAGIAAYMIIFDSNWDILQMVGNYVYNWPMTQNNPHVSQSYTLAVPENAYVLRFQVNFWDGTGSLTEFGMDDTFLTLHQVYDLTEPPPPAVPEPATVLLVLAGIARLAMRKR